MKNEKKLTRLKTYHLRRGDISVAGGMQKGETGQGENSYHGQKNKKIELQS